MTKMERQDYAVALAKVAILEALLPLPDEEARRRVVQAALILMDGKP